MTDIIDSVINILETAIAEKDWSRVVEAIHVLYEIPDDSEIIDPGEEDGFYETD